MQQFLSSAVGFPQVGNLLQFFMLCLFCFLLIAESMMSRSQWDFSSFLKSVIISFDNPAAFHWGNNFLLIGFFWPLKGQIFVFAAFFEMPQPPRKKKLLLLLYHHPESCEQCFCFPNSNCFSMECELSSFTSESD